MRVLGYIVWAVAVGIALVLFCSEIYGEITREEPLELVDYIRYAGAAGALYLMWVLLPYSR
ncbi:MAG: hypothetical protein KAX54_00140 [Thauera sp.]|nr:hypothetical protein [Thauera sp.]